MNITDGIRFEQVPATCQHLGCDEPTWQRIVIEIPEGSITAYRCYAHAEQVRKTGRLA